MAHQAHNIPWTLLASNLEWKTPTPYNSFVTNLYPRMKPNQAKDLTHFVNAFVKNLGEHAACERKKYPKHYDVPQASDVILDESTARRISPTVTRWREYCEWPLERDCTSGQCHGDDYNPRSLRDRICKCELIPHEERLGAAFLREPELDYMQYRDIFKDDAYFNIEIVKTLLLYGEMDPIFRICAHPENHLKFWFHGSFFDGPGDLGWKRICQQMLQVYICLNVAYCFPHNWDPASGKTERNDYRNARFYQRTLIKCGMSRKWDQRTYPHTQFFGLENSHFASKNTGKTNHWLLDEKHHIKVSYSGQPRFMIWQRDKEISNVAGIYGRAPIDEFLSFWLPNKSLYEPCSSDVDEVCQLLCSLGLPVELALDILMFADYNPRPRILKVPYDPLHPSNREALGKYLKYRWQTLVRCYILATELGMDPVEGEHPVDGMNWKNLVGNVIVDLFGYHKDGNEAPIFKAKNRLPRQWYRQESVLTDDDSWIGPLTYFV